MPILLKAFQSVPFCRFFFSRLDFFFSLSKGFSLISAFVVSLFDLLTNVCSKSLIFNTWWLKMKMSE